MIHRISKIVLSFIFLCIAFSGTDGTIRGQALDVNGEPLPGVQIYIETLGQGSTSDLDGNYIILNIQVGTYDVTARMIGFATRITQNVNVTMDQTVWLNLVLQEEAIEGEVIRVSGEKRLVEAGTTSKKITINQEAIAALPIKDVSELYSLQSGVVKVEGGMAGAIPDHEERGLEEVHVRGGRSGEIAYMIDGLYIRNPIYGGIGSGTRLNLFAVEEFDWQPGGFNSEYGDAMSAVSNIHTAFGRDKFRYRFRYETSAVGAGMGNEYDERRGYNDYNLGFGGKIPLANRVPFVKSAYYWFSGQLTDKQSYRVYQFDNATFQDGMTDENMDNLVTPWDDTAGFESFGFDKTIDIFGKITVNMLNNKLRFNYSYWEVDAHRKGFSTRYLYWDEGQNEIFRDTYRHTIEVNHTLSKKTFYTFRYSNFIQDYFIGTRWIDSDSDGYPDWFEDSYGAGTPPLTYVNDMISNPYNPNVSPFGTSAQSEIHSINRDGLGPNQWTSGWYFGAEPGNYNWEVAEEFIDVNQDGIFTEFIDLDGDGQKDPNEYYVDIFHQEHFIDINGNGTYDNFEDFYDYNGNGIHDTFDFDEDDDGEWDGPVLVQRAVGYYDQTGLLKNKDREGSYWLTPEMYVDYEKFFDENSFWYDIQGDPYYNYVGDWFDEEEFNELYFVGWTEERAFGGSDAFFGTSRAKTNEFRLDITSQLTDKWRTRIGGDYKIHKLNFYEIKDPWMDGSAIRQRFAEYWDDVGLDGESFLDVEGNQIDLGEGDGTWTCGYWDDDGNPNTSEVYSCEPYSDFNGDGKWNDYVQPLEIAGYWQNTFEVPWMVINAGVRIDGVNYMTKIWSDANGNYSPYKPWLWRDCGVDSYCPDDDYYPSNLDVMYNEYGNDGLFDILATAQACEDEGYTYIATDSNDDGISDGGYCEDPWEMDGNYQSNSVPGTETPMEEVIDDIGVPYSKVFFQDADWLFKISPRLGFSHVITDQATFTFNYGLYYQTPIYQNVYRNTNRAEDPQDTFEESEGQIGNPTMSASRTQSYEFGFNVQVGRHWAFSLMGWVKDMDQLVTAKTYRTGIYEYQVAANGDYGTAKGIDFTLENRGLLINTMLQYTYSVAEANGEYDASAFGNQYVDAPSQQYLMPFDRTHDLAVSFYTFLPFGITASMTHFYQSGFPYTPMIYNGNEPVFDELNKNTKRSPDWYWANLSLSKGLSYEDFSVTLGLNVYNVFDNINEFQIYELTGNAHDPGTYYTDAVALPRNGGSVSSAYYDRPWNYMSPKEINFFVRLDFK